LRVTISFEGLDTVVGNLANIEETAGVNLQKQVMQLAKATETAWRGATPRRSGRLQAGDKAESSGLQFTLTNPVRYYDWVSEGHNTAAGWHTKRGYRRAKRRSHVAGRYMTQAAMDFVEQNILEYMSRFLDNA
jgi:hypothetical protein